MERRRWVSVMVLICLFVACAGRENKIRYKDDSSIYNSTLAKILVEFTAAVYTADLTELFTWTCARCIDMTKDFEVVEIIVDVKNCLQAYVGVSEDPDSIIVVFRGTQEHSIQNWIEDLYWKQLDLNYPGLPGAMVHHGFYYAYHNTTMRTGVFDAIQKIRKLYGDKHITVVGHSMGGAMASFCALDLKVNYGARDVRLMTFGQPRIGNTAFASYFKEHLPHAIRVTNGHDLVPHLPPYYSLFPQKTYHHFPIEVWVHNVGLGSLVYNAETVCDDTGEDPACSRSVLGISILDHLVYLGVELQADTWRSCGIVTNKNLDRYRIDLSGNIVISRDQAAPILELNSEAVAGS
ncbi:Phospholipase A(1) DAD1, chloroplastic [Apostasia shenzhenica]|uniref:Phospholipase A(1) DAD1, chloroplastic n=1 Tax=Apostasia shenzhenica TaxID=1088818 RepID=A0A2I0AQ21_9ASPA|nr:Phospholipase A(1) DAD1, chloroplastic [Apostasia shenzhenica]